MLSVRTLASLLLPLLPVGCLYPTDAERYPRPGEPFSLLAATPADGATAQPTNVVLRLRFSDFPDPATLGALAIRSGQKELRCGPDLPCQVDLLGREIVILPARLDAQQEHQIEISAALRSLAGVALPGPRTLRLRTGDQPQVVPPPPPLRLADILGDKGLLRSSCTLPGVCHGQAQGQPAARGLDLTLPAELLWKQLTTTQALGTPEGLLLVEPGRPERSYLLRKMLAFDGFLRTEGDPMPLPPFARLSDAALQATSDWIRQGAPK